jgi:hypothetical protein
LRWTLLGLVAIVVLAFAGSFVYVSVNHVAAVLVLPKQPAGVAQPAGTTPHSANAGLTGTWTTATGSIAGYRLPVTVMFEHTTLVHRTSEIEGRMAVTANSVTSGDFSVEVGGLLNGSGQRSVVDASSYPRATFLIDHPVDLSGLPGSDLDHIDVAGTLSIRGVTRPTIATVSLQRSANAIDALADIHVDLSAWNVNLGGAGELFSIDPHATLEVLLVLHRDSST